MIKIKEATQDAYLEKKNKHVYINSGDDNLLRFPFSHFSQQRCISKDKAPLGGSVENASRTFVNRQNYRDERHTEGIKLCNFWRYGNRFQLSVRFYNGLVFFYTSRDKRAVNQHNSRKGPSHCSQPCQTHLLLFVQVCVNERVTNTLTQKPTAGRVLLLPAQARYTAAPFLVVQMWGKATLGRLKDSLYSSAYTRSNILVEICYLYAVAYCHRAVKVRKQCHVCQLTR